MSIRHIIYTQEPGIDGNGITAIEKEQMVLDVADAKAGVDRIAPPIDAPGVGATLRQGPTGPAWMKDAVSADWYSDPNDAIADAGIGGRVFFSADTVYDLPEPLRLKTGVQLVGGDKSSTVLKGPGVVSPIVVDNPNVLTVEVSLDNFRVDANGADIGVDFRCIAHSSIDQITVENVGAGGKGIYFGGNGSYGGWSTRMWRSRIRGVLNGSTVYLDGTTDGTPSGVPNANFIQIFGCVLYLAGQDSVGIHIEMGHQNFIMANDIGYDPGLAFKIGARGSYNRSIGNRSELVDGFAEVAGSYNSFRDDHMHMRTPATRRVVSVVGNGQYNRFEPSYHSSSGPQPWYAENDPARNSLFIQPTHEVFGQRGMQFRTNSIALMTARDADTQDRFRLTGEGTLAWGDGTNALALTINRRGDGDLQVLGGNLMTQGTWNGSRLRLGNYHLWVDSTGALRMKNGAPASDTDGTVVGSQT